MSTEAGSLEDRIARIEAGAAIIELLTEYTILVDNYDIDGVAALFTDDCITDYGPGRGGLVIGRDNVRDRIRRGGWRIAERKVVAAGVEGFEGVEWCGSRGRCRPSAPLVSRRRRPPLGRRRGDVRRRRAP